MGERTGLLWPWAEHDRAHIFEQYANNMLVLCPIDELPLRVVKRHGFVRFRCIQCGNTGSFEAPNSVARTEKAPRVVR
jgi:hypothetical protein